MTRKKLDIGLRPGVQQRAEEWVQERTESSDPPPEAEPSKRLTIDIPESLHRDFKIKSVADGVRMADLVRKWIAEYCRPS